ncbi:AAA family ATPase [Polaromonas sp. YR568]|uniref:AAA family ATPase n=1 Tax=Polaromonas sp. YR568 TaxID=1855301 RepID=UPI003137DB20
MILDSIKIKNFKAVRDSGAIKLGPLTALVGNNGSGKSSLIEALETYQSIVADGLDVAMQRFMGIEHVQNKRAKPETAISFDLRMRGPFGKTHMAMAVASDKTRSAYEITDETVVCKEHLVLGGFLEHEKMGFRKRWDAGFSMLGSNVYLNEYANLVESWQFLTLSPERMGYPLPQKRTGGRARLARDGSNIAEFLLDLRERDVRVLEGIIRTMTYVLPYARDLQPAITSELERKAWLQLTEGEFKVPGWMLSTGTLRVLALLALLRHPTPPPLLVIEEIENGLDPRSIHLLVEEVRRAVLSGTTQVILTTHSPYLLDLLKLDQLVLVNRNEAGEPHFYRPASNAKLVEWAKEFAPGRLYTMGSLHEAAQ